MWVSLDVKLQFFIASIVRCKITVFWKTFVQSSCLIYNMPYLWIPSCYPTSFHTYLLVLKFLLTQTEYTKWYRYNLHEDAFKWWYVSRDFSVTEFHWLIIFWKILFYWRQMTSLKYRGILGQHGLCYNTNMCPSFASSRPSF